ncbi:pyridoxal phosphate-dependent aminotransferase [bacterium]|nr:pyridoxal phosphate-dependent aminotransferase [candidate division CSSED10-310 bacterium]
MTLAKGTVSERMGGLGTENAFVVLKEVNDLIAQGKKIMNFCIGQPDFKTPKHICDAAKEAIDNGLHGYTPSSGIPALRKAAAQYFTSTRGLDYTADDIVIACGGKPFIWYTIFAVTDPGKGHEVIFPNPGFPIYESMIKGMGAVPVPLYLREDKNFNFNIGELREKITPRTKLLILNSPHNPTGGVLSKAELEEIADICIKNDIWVYADEVYSNLVFDAPFASIASVPGMKDRTVVVDCASKTYAMTGWRIGYMANTVLAPHITRLVTNSDSCAPHPNQVAVAAALTGPQAEVQEMARIFRERRDIIVPGLNAIPGISCRKPGGAFYVWPNVTDACRLTGCKDSEAFRIRLLYEAGVACLADIHFGPRVPDEGQHIRFSYASSADDIREGLSRIVQFMEKNTA